LIETLPIIMSLGIGVVAAAIILVICERIDAVLISNRLMAWNKRQIGFPDNRYRKIILVMFCGAVFGAVLAWGSPRVIQVTLLGAVITVGVYELVSRIKEHYEIKTRRFETLRLFNVIGLYIEAGMTIPQALNHGKQLSPSLRPMINQCLTLWASGSSTALQALKKSINLPEGDILVSLLEQLNSEGVKNYEGIMRRESRQMERQYHKQAAAKLPLKSIYISVYQALPVFTLFGLLAGAAYVYAMQTLRATGWHGF